ncbi:MAG TPA: hypothetical protein VG125_04530 [Pirellulales bacterium]|jgi:hypothetical protein|nr:hypothetical protein [Pirellulales bacterium]
MASGAYIHGIRQTQDGTYVMTSATLKIMLVNNLYVFAKTHTVVDDGTSTTSCLKFEELNATNYTRGFGGAGRQVATLAISESSSAVILAFTNLTWNALGGASNDTVGAGVLIRESGNDTTSIPIAYLQITATPTNGSNFTLSFASAGSGGNLAYNC